MVIVSIKLADGSVIRSRTENGSCSTNGVRPLKWKPRKVSCVRNFPPGCGPVLLPVNVHETEPLSSPLNVVPLHETEPLPSPVTNNHVPDAATIEQVGLVVENVVNNGLENGDNEAAPKVKFKRRRVSAVRDFPPYCGLNAEEPTEEERRRINGLRSHGTEHKTQSNESNESSIKKVQNIGQACQELVVYTRDKASHNSSPVNDVEIDDVKIDDVKIDDEEDDDDRDNTPLSVIQKGMNVKNHEAGSSSKKLAKKKPLDNTYIYMGDKIKVVMGLKAPSFCPTDSVPKKHVKVEKDSVKPKNVSKKSKKVVKKEEEDVDNDTEVKKEGFPPKLDLTLPPLVPTTSNAARDKVRKTLRLFQTLCRKLLQGEEAKPDDLKLPKQRVDLQAKAMMDQRGQSLALGKRAHGPVPGVEVGDEFMYRVELALVGVHRIFQGGIDYVKKGNKIFAVSVVASGGYDNDVGKPDWLTYSGAGGVGKDKSVENQKLERGNLALSNNIETKYPVRVVRGDSITVKSESSDSKTKVSKTYIYDGLYTVESCVLVPGPKGNMVYKFELKRVPGQPQLAIREVKSKKFKKREGVCVKDITNGKEVFPICAINTIDNEKPPEFTYITKIMYPEWYDKAVKTEILPKGCECVGRCSDKRCACGLKNGGEIPYNHNGAIVEAKALVYECGPSCKCPPSCYNRVTQNGMKIRLEIFKTETRGWGVRSLSSISSGSFICEYVGELIEDKEAERRTGSDEYLFDIGQNYTDCTLNTDVKSEPDVKSEEIDGFTIDALNYGNVGRFINHSCSPNLYAQNVVYDQDDVRMPHIMLFAAENIPPLQELTYHYNYAVDTVHDAEGNIKVKSCFCGSSECSGRLY